ncbi:MAG: DoxX family protein [Pseudomonadota bacterium]
MDSKKTAQNRILASDGGVAALLLRVPVGTVLAAHGAQKLFGWFGGYGLDGTGQWLASIGFEPGYLMALLAGGAEFFGGLALVAGVLTRPAALVAAFTMLMAMTVHLGNGLFVSNNGYEFALTLLAATSALAFLGGGAFSVDQMIGRRHVHPVGA